MKRGLLVFATVASALALAADKPTPKPNLGAKPPDGAIVLFDGTNTAKWATGKMTSEGLLMAGARTRDAFGDCRLHLEFNIQPGEGGKRVSGNSGVYIQERYEVQILNSYGQRPSKSGCGAIYRFKAPDVNASLPLGRWQSYDITFHAPRWEGNKKIKNARLTVIHNGIKVHDDVEVPNKTGHGKPEGPEPRPLYLQYHGNVVYFRNVWLLPLAN